jgi:hypothetical protein
MNCFSIVVSEAEIKDDIATPHLNNNFTAKIDNGSMVQERQKQEAEERKLESEKEGKDK